MFCKLIKKNLQSYFIMFYRTHFCAELNKHGTLSGREGGGRGAGGLYCMSFLSKELKMYTHLAVFSNSGAKGGSLLFSDGEGVRLLPSSPSLITEYIFSARFKSACL